MKVTPVAQSNGAQTTVNPNEGKSASADRISRAKAAMRGEDPNKAVQSQQETTKEPGVRKIKMNTQKTPAPRDWIPEGAQEVTQVETATQTTQAASEPAKTADNSDNGEQTTASLEDNNKLSPQSAALLKRQRAVQVKEAEVAKREQAVADKEKAGAPLSDINAEVLADPLGFVLKRGVTWEQLTKSAEKHVESTPGLSRVETELRSEIKSLKEAIENQNKTVTDTLSASEQRALAQTQKQADQLIASDDAYQMIRETHSGPEVSALIKRVLKEEGQILDVREALEIIEKDLLDESLKLARIKKVQQGLEASPATQQTQGARANDGQNRQTMRTLTNRDTVSAVPSARDRAIAAFHGKKLA